MTTEADESASVAVVYGAATPPGRLERAAQYLRRFIENDGSQHPAPWIHCGELPWQFCDGRPTSEYDPKIRDAIDTVSRAEAVILLSPVYRGTYTGILKNFLDLLPVDALRGKPVGVVAMGASDHHYLGVAAGLREVLTWFGAVVMPTASYLTGADFDRGELTQRAQTELGELAASVLSTARRGDVDSYRPLPLAARFG